MKIKLNYYNKVYFSCALMAFILILRCINNAFIAVAILAGFSIVLLCDKFVVLPFLMFLLPLASIYKISPSQMSIFTLLYLLYVIKIILKKKIKKSFLISVGVFFLYGVAISSLNKLVVVATMVCGLIMINDISTAKRYDLKITLHMFSLGIILSSILGIMREYLPILNNLVNVKKMQMNMGESAERFSGLVGDPNYFSMYVLIALACITVIILKEKKNNFEYVLFIMLSCFGLMTVSKMFILILAILWIIILINALYVDRKKFIALIIILSIGVIFARTFMANTIAVYIYRFSGMKTQSLNEFSSGRSNITKAYIDAICGNIKILLFGAGVESILPIAAPHNTYVQTVYSLGVFGTVLLLIVMKISIVVPKHRKYNLILWVPVGVLIGMFLGLGTLTSDMLPFLISLILMTFIKYSNVGLEEVVNPVTEKLS